MSNSTYVNRRAAGLCTRCRKPSTGATCAECKAKDRKRKKARGQCSQCSTQAIKGRSKCERCLEKFTIYSKKHRDALKREILEAYGNHCACCDETEPLFLTIDHINQDGAEHRRSIGGQRWAAGGTNTYRWLKQNGFPRDNFQLLCSNCNTGRARNGGICPHQT